MEPVNESLQFDFYVHLWVPGMHRHRKSGTGARRLYLQFDCADENGATDEPLQLSSTRTFSNLKGGSVFFFFSPRFPAHVAPVRGGVFFREGGSFFFQKMRP